MDTRTPRKRKFSSVSSDGGHSFYGTPVKKLIVDYSNCPSPLTTRNSSRQNVKSPPVRSYTDMSDLTEKENVGASPLKSSAARKLVVSPIQTAAAPRAVYGTPPLVSSPRSPFTASVSTLSFYKRDKVYITPLDRKLINESKSSSPSSSESPMSSPTSPVSSGSSRVKQKKQQPGKRKSGTKGKKTPRGSGKKTPHKPSPSTPIGRKAPPSLSTCKPTPSPCSDKPAQSPLGDKPTSEKGMEVNALPSAPTPATEESASTLCMKTTFLGLKMKPRPKLTVGAAFFATGKRPHSAPKRPSPNIKFPPLAKPVKKNTMPITKALPPHPVLKAVVCVAEGQKQGQEDVRKMSNVPSEEKGRKEPKPALKESEIREKVKLRRNPVDQERLPTSPEQADPGMQKVAPDSPVVASGEDRSVAKKSHKKGPTVFPIFSSPAANKRPLELRDLASPMFSSTPTNALAALRFPKQGKKKRDGKKVTEDQLIIDAGQRHFGPVACTTCGMVYAAANLEDEAQHVQYHQRLLEGIRYVGWKKERVITEFWDGKIILVSPEDPKYALKKAEEVRELVDSELGFQQVSLRCPRQTRTYMFVSNEKKIVGCLIAEPIREAYRVLAEPPSPHSVHGEPLERHRAWRCSTEPEPAICGISRIWVFALVRRKAIASRMVDAVRSSFMYGSVLAKEEIAFSDPTPDGKLFASTYCRVPDFLVYNFVS